MLLLELNSLSDTITRSFAGFSAMLLLELNSLSDTIDQAILIA